ncbi:hypothetical protein [Nitrosopumilus sp.]|uniref:hypothetical protein n=1 Tax=Nitrosopumilus sp. TaxID=2024843 RepID=UPI00247E2B83|nr:hypothetical protein [Nitrosopumilus sp.]MCV0431673.1 hypothetical protein [Nitrosopumilus sp.]
MKKGIIKGVQKIKDEKSYIPDETLVTFIQDWLHIHKKRERLTKEGKELSSEDKKKLRALDKKKVDYIDNTIFPAFANLTYFFEAMAASPRLAKGFEEELEEILDPRKSKDAATFSGNRMRMSSIQFRNNNLARLVDAALSIHMKNYERGKPITDFRVGLMYQILGIIGDYMDTVISNEYSSSQIWYSFHDDFKRMLGWMALLTRTIKDTPKEYDRKLQFQPIWFSNKTPTGGWDF